MNTINIAFTVPEYQKLIELIAEFDEVWGNDEDTEWTFDDLSSFPNIGLDIVAIIRNKLIKDFSESSFV